MRDAWISIFRAPLYAKLAGVSNFCRAARHDKLQNLCGAGQNTSYSYVFVCQNIPVLKYQGKSTSATSLTLLLGLSLRSNALIEHLRALF